jgi:hypothetical protein
MAAPNLNLPKGLTMNRNEAFPSRFLKAADLTQPRVGIISYISTERFPDDDRDKLIVNFETHGIKPMVLNVTNFDAIAEIAGTDETDRWPRLTIELFATKVPLRGKLVDAVRVRAATQAAQAQGGSGQGSWPEEEPAPRPPQRPPQQPPPRQPVPLRQPASDDDSPFNLRLLPERPGHFVYCGDQTYEQAKASREEEARVASEEPRPPVRGNGSVAVHQTQSTTGPQPRRARPPGKRPIVGPRHNDE